jgi:cytochrome c oxidase subunit III
MKPLKSKTGVVVKKPVLDRIENIHPHKMINYLTVSISCLLYAFITYLFIKSLINELEGSYSFSLPKFFTVSTLLLAVSGLFTSRLMGAYKNDEISLLRKQLSFLLLTGLLFFISQSAAWIELLYHDQAVENTQITTYLVTFTIVHLTFVFVGMIMAAILFYRYMLIENDPVKTLIAVTNPSEKVKLEIFKTFWYFNMLAWALIFLMLLFIF